MLAEEVWTFAEVLRTSKTTNKDGKGLVDSGVQ